MAEATAKETLAYIGADVGGTHTDVAVILGERISHGKAFTTYDDFSKGLLSAIEVAAEEMGLGLEDLLGRTQVLFNGTTVVTNALTELRGDRVGALITTGFKDTFRWQVGMRRNVVDDHLQVNPPDLVDRLSIREIDGRIDYAGREVVALNEQQVHDEVRHLVEDRHVEAIAVCFLSSFVNPAHEARVVELIAEDYPDLFVTPSYQSFPVRGENRRWTTAVMNCFVQGSARRYLNSTSDRLAEAGFKGSPAFFQGLGGAISRERASAYPLALYSSGPAAGAIGARHITEQMGVSKVLIGDMGGTSFDTGIIEDGNIRIEKELELGPFKTGVNVIDITSIGAGGGSIAWVSDRGVPQVGPHSARSTPGPACYGTGGEDPTVTDAMVVMGFIDPDNYLGGRFHLSAALAAKALDEKVGRRFSWSPEETGAVIHDLIVVNMATAVREISIEKGHDPRDFAFLAYGGTLPLFAWQIAARLNISKVIVPPISSAFSALGLLMADFNLRMNQTVDWSLDDQAGLERVNEKAKPLVAGALAAMKGEGFTETEIEIKRSGDFRFAGQVYDIAMKLPDRPLIEADISAMKDAFFGLYEKTYGVGTGWKGVPEMLTNYSVEAIGRMERPRFSYEKSPRRTVREMTKSTRAVFLPDLRERRNIPILDGLLFSPSSVAEGPLIVDATDTTMYVPAGVTVTRDANLSYILTGGTE